jgi:hypothetical protein
MILRDKKERNYLSCYYKVLTLPMKTYRIISKWTWISCKYILQTLGQPLLKSEKRNITGVY